MSVQDQRYGGQTQPQSQQAPGGIIGTFLRGLFGGGGETGRSVQRAPVILRLVPQHAENILSRIESEVFRERSRYEGFTKEEVKDLLIYLSEETDKFTEIGNILARPFLTFDSMIIDFRTARTEIKQRLTNLAVIGQVIFENYMGNVIESVERALSRLREEGLASPYVAEDVARAVEKIVEAYKLLINLIGGLLDAMRKMRLVLYLNMPAEQRSSIINQLLGFDIVRP